MPESCLGNRKSRLGLLPKDTAQPGPKEKRQQLLQDEVRAGVEEERVSRAVGLWQQGAWTRWESVLQCKVTGSNILQADFNRVRFPVQVVYDVLPSPANLQAWGKSETPSYPLCSGRRPLEHLLSSCPKALADGRYRWRHSQVLRAVAERIASAVCTSKHHHTPKKAILFITAGERPRKRPQTSTGLLHTASDWQQHAEVPPAHSNNISLARHDGLL